MKWNIDIVIKTTKSLYVVRCRQKFWSERISSKNFQIFKTPKYLGVCSFDAFNVHGGQLYMFMFVVRGGQKFFWRCRHSALWQLLHSSKELSNIQSLNTSGHFCFRMYSSSCLFLQETHLRFSRSKKKMPSLLLAFHSFLWWRQWSLIIIIFNRLSETPLKIQQKHVNAQLFKVHPSCIWIVF